MSFHKKCEKEKIETNFKEKNELSIKNISNNIDKSNSFIKKNTFGK